MPDPISLDEAALGWLAYRYNPVAFCHEQLGAYPDPWQCYCLSQLARDDVTSLYIRSGHGPGKTHLAALTATWAGCTWGRMRIPCTAPKESTLLKKLWPELYKILAHASPEVQALVEWRKTGMTFMGEPGWEAIPETAREPEGLAGHHEERVLFIVEEASGLRDDFWPVIEGALTTEGSKLLAISNPTRISGGFARAFRVPSPGTHLVQVGWEAGADTRKPRHARTAAGAHLVRWASDRPSSSWAEKQIQQYGWDSNIVRVRVRGEEPLAEDDTLVAPYLVWDAWGRMPDRDSTELGLKVLSWDVAGAGRDRSVQSYRRGPLVLSLKGVPQVNLHNAAQLILETCEGMPLLERPDHVNIDEIGIGRGPVDTLHAKGFGAQGVNVALPSRVKDYANLRAQYYWELRKDFMDARLCLSKSIPEETVQQLADELAATKWFITAGGKIQIVPKDAIRQDIGRSPDLADTLMLYYARPGDGSVLPTTAAKVIGRSVADRQDF